MKLNIQTFCYTQTFGKYFWGIKSADSQFFAQSRLLSGTLKTQIITDIKKGDTSFVYRLLNVKQCCFYLCVRNMITAMITTTTDIIIIRLFL